jgi:hypothetical protein
MGPFHSLYSHSFVHTHAVGEPVYSISYYVIVVTGCSPEVKDDSYVNIFILCVCFVPSKSVPHTHKSVLNNKGAVNREGKDARKVP